MNAAGAKHQGHGVHLSYYDFGRTTAYGCQSDPRFSYCAYVPEGYAKDGTDRVGVQMVVGAGDRETWEITIKPGDPWWQPDANIAGGDRPARLDALKASFEAQGIAVRRDIVPDIAHTLPGLVPVVEDFFDTAFGDVDCVGSVR